MTAPAREAERLGELLKAATPLPWDYVQAAPHRLCHVETSCENPHGAGLPVCSIPAKRECDAALIVAAVNALPGLLAERAALVEALESEKKNASALYGEIEDLRAEFERATDRLHVRLAAAEVALSSFEVKPPDGDGDVWMTMKHSAGSAMLNLGKAERITAQVGQLLEEDRRAALVGGQADEPV